MYYYHLLYYDGSSVTTVPAVSAFPPLVPFVGVSPDLTSCKYTDLFKATVNEISTILWCQNNGLIAKVRVGVPLKLQRHKLKYNVGH